MSYGNRSKEYDWFKGTSSGQKNDPKDTMKTIWRFIKIFLMFSLFFFSMWGCVQVFIIKTDTHVGDGVEFYNSEEEIAPHVAQFRFKEDANSIYSIENEGTNVWLNETENTNELKLAQNTLTNNGVHKMSDAIKGTNEYARIIDEDGSIFIGSTFKKDDAIDPKADKVVAVSTEQTTYAGINNATPLNMTLNLFIWNEVISSTHPVASTEIASTTTIKESAATDKAQIARIQFQKGLLQQIDASIKAVETEKNINLDYLKSTATINDVTTKEQVIAHDNTWQYILNYLRPSIISSDDKVTPNTSVIELTGMDLSGTKYRPIITWGQAWTRGAGPFYGLFVWPIAKMGVGITNGLGLHAGWESLFAIVIIVFILRLLAFGLTFNSIMQQTKQQELQSKKAVIDAKYANYKGNKQMEARKRQETAELYKKEGVSPLGALGTVFITMPIFLSIWRVIGGVPHLKSTVWLGINFSATSYKELFTGHWQYLPLMLIAAGAAAFQQIYPRLLTKRRDKNRINVHQKEAMKKNNKTQNIVLVVFVGMSLIFSAGIQIYWIVGGIWQLIQASITHHILVNQKKRNKKRVKV